MRNTPNYNLPQFDGTDKFDKDILNDAYMKLDDAINDLQETFNLGAGDAGLLSKEVVEARKGKAKLVDKITELEEMQTQIDTWNSFKANGGEIGGDIVPKTDRVSKLGTPTKRFKEINVGGMSLHTSDQSDNVDRIKTIKQILALITKNPSTNVDLGVLVDADLKNFRPIDTSKNDFDLGSESNPFRHLFLGSPKLDGTSGFCQLNNKMYLQWGTVNVQLGQVGSATQTVTLPMLFDQVAFAGASCAFNVTDNNVSYCSTISTNARRGLTDISILARGFDANMPLKTFMFNWWTVGWIR